MVRVINNGRGKLNLRFGVSLPPGAEVEVSPEMWGKCKDDPITKHYLSIQQVQVVTGSSKLPPTDQGGEPVAPEPGPESKMEAIEIKVAPLEEWPKLKVREVAPLVGELQDQTDLKKLLTLDSRPRVRAAVEHQLEKLRAKG